MRLRVAVARILHLLFLPYLSFLFGGERKMASEEFIAFRLRLLWLCEGQALYNWLETDCSLVRLFVALGIFVCPCSL